jgi:hypothetical protein
LGLEETGSEKRYYDLKEHGGCSMRQLLDGIQRSNPGLLADGFDRLCHAVLAAEAKTWLSGGVVQMRRKRCASLWEAKAYLSCKGASDLDVRRAAMLLSLLVDGEDRLRVRREIPRRHAVAPLLYVSIAFRPDIEIETYHDGPGPLRQFSSSEAKQISSSLSGCLDPRMCRALDTAHDLGILCTHISVDLVGAGAPTLTLLFDVPHARGPEALGVRAGLISQLCAIAQASPCPMAAASGQPTTKGLSQVLVAVNASAPSVFEASSGRMRVSVEEVSERFLQHL